MPGRTSRPSRRWIAAVLATAACGLAACGDDGEDSGGDDGAAATASVAGPVAIVVKTRVDGPAGDVVAGSTLGGSPFCVGGTVRHERGSPDIGFPAVNVLGCPEGELQIGFGPGPDQMNDVVQTSHWKVLEGTGDYAGMTGEGEMTVEWESVGSPQGAETFTGEVVLP